jgi:hypothetical protein
MATASLAGGRFSWYWMWRLVRRPFGDEGPFSQLRNRSSLDMPMSRRHSRGFFARFGAYAGCTQVPFGAAEGPCSGEGSAVLASMLFFTSNVGHDTIFTKNKTKAWSQVAVAILFQESYPLKAIKCRIVPLGIGDGQMLSVPATSANFLGSSTKDSAPLVVDVTRLILHLRNHLSGVSRDWFFALWNHLNKLFALRIYLGGISWDCSSCHRSHHSGTFFLLGTVSRSRILPFRITNHTRYCSQTGGCAQVTQHCWGLAGILSGYCQELRRSILVCFQLSTLQL